MTSLVDVPGAEIIVTNVDVVAKRAGDYTIRPGESVRVPISFLNDYGAAAGLHFDFSPVAGYLASRTEDGRPVVDFYSPLSAVDGYGRHALDIHRGMVELGAAVSLRASRFVDPSFLGSDVLAEARANERRPPARVGIAMSVPYDPILTDNRSVVRVAITQFETDRIPQRHIDHVNRCDMLITTSSFQPEVWRRSGLKIPIAVLTPGIDTDFFAYRERRMTSHFRVLILGALSQRKNTVGAIRIFQEAADGNPDWRLTIKSRAMLEPGVRQLVDQDSRITLEFGDVPAEHVRDLYHEHDCFLWPSKGEGVGLPPLEAMATGMELVCSDNSGMSDYVGDDLCYPIRTAGLIPADGPGECFAPMRHGDKVVDYVADFGAVGNYWRPDHGHAVKQLGRCFNNWLDGKGKGERAARYVREHHTIRHQAASVLKAVERFLV